MRYTVQILKEQTTNFHLIHRLALFNLKSTYQMHYLGMLWQFLNPTIQVLVFWFVFGIGIRGGNPVGKTPFFVWLVVGFVPWFFASAAIINGSNSVYANVGLVSKLKFPISLMPSIIIYQHAINFFVMSGFVGLILLLYKINPGLYLLQLPYFLLSLFIFLYAVTLFCSTITTIVRDFQLALQATVRIIFFITPIMWDASNLSNLSQTILKLNPLMYLIEGFRNTLLGTKWFFVDITYTLYFWSVTLFILFIGSFFHMKFRNKFVDYL